MVAWSEVASLVLMMVILGRLMLWMLLLSVWRSLLAPMLEKAKSLVVSFPRLRVKSLLLTLLWSDGSLVLDGFSGIGVAGCGVWCPCIWCCLDW